jgi:hypothetical protein
MRFSNKIPKYSQFSVPPLKRLNNPAEQWFLGGIFALSVCHIGNAAELLYCLSVSALFALRFFCLVFNNRWLWSIGIRCIFRLQTRSPTWPHPLSSALSHALPPTSSRAWRPTPASGRHRLVCISRCEPLRLHIRARPAHTSWAKLSPPAIDSPALWGDISTLETSAASTLDCCAWALESSATSALEALAESAWTSASPALDVLIRALAVSTPASALTALNVLIWTLAERAIWALWSPVSPAESTRASTLSGLDILIRALAPRAIWTRYPGIIRLCRIVVCFHLRSAGHSTAPSRPAAPSLSAATAAATSRSGKRLAGQDCQCQHKNDRCCNFCLFHFRFLSQKFHFTAFLSPEMGSFYRDSGAGGKQVTPKIKVYHKNIRVIMETEMPQQPDG